MTDKERTETKQSAKTTNSRIKGLEGNLSPVQIEYVRLAIENSTMTKEELAKMVGVSRTTTWRWFKDKDFLEYFKQELDAFTDSEFGTVWNALVRKASKGNVQAIKLYMEMKDEYIPPTQKINQTVEGDGIKVVFDIPRPEITADKDTYTFKK